MASIRFLGAAQEVTGSCHLLSSAAVGKVLDQGLRTADIMSDGGQKVSTREMGEAVLNAL